MKLIKEFTDSPKQKCKLVLDNNKTADFYMWYAPTQQSWYFNFSYENITSNGNKIVLGFNILRSFKNIIPFGLMVKSLDGVDPFDLNDFKSGRVSFYLLNSEDVQAIEKEIYNYD